VLIFWNIDGIRRVLGLAESLEPSPTLVELFGTPERVRELREAINRTTDPLARETIALDAYRRALRTESGAQYLAPFRVEAEERRKTSHFLLHATKSALGFKIMKSVMAA